jgi:hypothetical protein
MTVTASPVPILKDNYAWLLRESSTGANRLIQRRQPVHIGGGPNNRALEPRPDLIDTGGWT